MQVCDRCRGMERYVQRFYALVILIPKDFQCRQQPLLSCSRDPRSALGAAVPYTWLPISGRVKEDRVVSLSRSCWVIRRELRRILTFKYPREIRRLVEEAAAEQSGRYDQWRRWEWTP